MFTILDYTYQNYYVIIYTPNFIDCYPPYSKQAEELSQKMKAPDIHATCIWMMEGVLRYMLLMFCAEHVQRFSFQIIVCIALC